MTGHLNSIDGDQPLIPTEVLELRQGMQALDYEAWADKLGSFADRRPLNASDRTQTWKLSQWTIDNLQVREFTTGPEDIVRRPVHVRRSFGEYVVLHLNLFGKRYSIHGDSVQSMQPNEIHLHDVNLPTRLITNGPLLALTVFLPYKAIGYDPSRYPSTLSVSTTTAIGRMLQSAMMALRNNVDVLHQSDAPALAAGFSGMVRGLMMTDTADEFARAQVTSSELQRLKSYIEENLYNPVLGTEVLCKVFRTSPASINRKLAQEGGVANYVKERRLMQAFGRLSAVRATTRTAEAVAKSLGFDNQSHFNRLFRNKFLISPTDSTKVGDDKEH